MSDDWDLFNQPTLDGPRDGETFDPYRDEVWFKDLVGVTLAE